MKYKETLFMIHSYIGTSRGRFGRKIKNNRHNFTGAHLDIILDMSSPEVKKVGNFFLYSINEINRLKLAMDKLIL